MAVDSLFSPFRCKSLSTYNRFVMAPMGRSRSPNGVPTIAVADYYARRAAANVGLIISEATSIDRPAALNDPHAPRFHGKRELAGWRQVIDAVHAVGGMMAPQLWHSGAVRTRHENWSPPSDYESPSGLSCPGKPLGVPMKDHEVADAIVAFAKAAAEAKRLGFESVELHGAHGYLIDQFFWDGTNNRAGSYGGASLVERSRFAGDILRATRVAVGVDYPIIVRLSQWKQQDYSARLAQSPREMQAWLGALVDAGADILHCSQRRFWEPEFETDGSDLNFAGWAKKLTGCATITVGSIGLSGEFSAPVNNKRRSSRSINELLRRFDRGDFDLIAVGRALLQDPTWVDKIRNGRHGELYSFTREALLTLS